MNSAIPCPCCYTQESEAVKDYSFSIYDSIDSISEREWNRQIPETNLLMQYAELQMLEASQQGKMQFKYALVKKEDAVIGAIYFQIVAFRGADLMNYYPLPPRGAKKYLYSVTRFFSEPLIRSIDLKMLVCGNVF